MVDEPDDDRKVYNLGLTVRGKGLRFQARVSRQPIRVTDLLPIIHGLAQISVDAATARTEEDGKSISCRAGCGACCRQIVPIGLSEARHLAELVESMPPERREKYRKRFREALEGFERNGLGDKLRQIDSSEDEEEKRQFGHAYFDQRIACPFLVDESCSIHLHRPLVCREYLVTSPPELCARPEARDHEPVELPTYLAKILFHFEDGEGRDESRWLPLVLALEWAEVNRDRAARTFPGTQLFQSFLTYMAESMEAPGCDPDPSLA